MTKRLFNLGRSMLFLLLLMAHQAWPQSQTIKGKVSSLEDGSGLPGVSILEKGTENGVVSDANGNYSLEVKSNAVLVFSFVGYLTQEIEVGNKNLIDVSLTPDITALSEVVVIGYGTVKKEDATGSVSQVNTSAFNRGVVSSPQELFMGKVAGVAITTNSGAPGNASTIRIRGGASLNASNDPLIVIDGLPISNTNLGGSPNILATINPNDIENITILKDASATAIFGSRASNGVILITTKRGSQEFKVDYNLTTTLYTAPKKIDVYTGDEFRALLNEQFEGNDAVLSLLGDDNTDWQSEIFQNSFGQDHNINVSGMAIKTPYRASLGYNNTDGILKTYNFERTTLAIGLDPSFFNDRLKISINIKGMLNNNNFADQGAIGDAVRYDPTKPVYNGNTRWRGYTTWTNGGAINGTGINLAPGNPLARLELTDNTSEVKRSLGNVKFDYELPFIQNLTATLNLGYDYGSTEGRNNVMDSTQWVFIQTEGDGRINPYQASSKNELLDFYLNYSKDLETIDSRVDVVGGYSWSHFHLAGSDSTMNRYGLGTSRINIYETEYYLISFFGRLNYTFKDKYLLTATLRNDATSRFNPDIRWGLFPSVAFAWKINEEAFLKNTTWLNELKLRTGYGVTGQQDLFGSDYPYLSTYTMSDDAAQYQLGNTYYHTLRPDGYDRNIKWESTTTINAGIDFGLFQNRITGSFDVYNKKTTDLIAFIPTPVGSNFASRITTNSGAISNSGVELNLNGVLLDAPDFQWEAGLNITYNKNKITKLNLSNDPNFILLTGGVGGTTSGTIQVQKVGYPRFSYYVYEQVYDEEGNPIEDVYVDRNLDGTINTSDLYVYQNPDAQVFLGINSRANYKNWDLSFSGRASFGNYVYNNVAAASTYQSLYSSLGYLANVSTQADKTQFTVGGNTRFSDYYIEDASFFRMDNINVGYSFHKLFKESLKVRLGASVQNAFVITNYTGLDPEVSGGLDNNFFPRTRSFVFSLSAQF